MDSSTYKGDLAIALTKVQVANRELGTSNMNR
jgi:hypothetical protein